MFCMFLMGVWRHRWESTWVRGRWEPSSQSVGFVVYVLFVVYWISTSVSFISHSDRTNNSSSHEPKCRSITQHSRVKLETNRKIVSFHIHVDQIKMPNNQRLEAYVCVLAWSLSAEHISSPNAANHMALTSQHITYSERPTLSLRHGNN